MNEPTWCPQHQWKKCRCWVRFTEEDVEIAAQAFFNIREQPHPERRSVYPQRTITHCGATYELRERRKVSGVAPQTSLENVKPWCESCCGSGLAKQWFRPLIFANHFLPDEKHRSCPVCGGTGKQKEGA